MKVPPDGIPFLQHVNHTTQLGVISNVAEGALDPTVHVTDKDVKQRWSKSMIKRINAFSDHDIILVNRLILLRRQFIPR